MTVALDNVSFSYGTSGAGVRHVTLTIGQGELVAVIGPSGCGKTTVLKLLAGFLRPDEGRIVFAGADVSATPTRDRDLGIVFQNYALFPHMSALENIAYPLKLRGVGATERAAKAREALDKVRLSQIADRLPAKLSGGQQQRVALARALVFRPRALLLDEPLSALDASHRMEMRDEVRRLQQEHRIATLHITHDQEEALSMADRVVVMSEGRILQTGSPHDIYNRPLNKTVAAFVGQSNLWDGLIAEPGRVSTPIGMLVAATDRRPIGAAVAVLIRPERIRVANGADLPNTLEGSISRDRFLGPVRRFDLAVPGGLVTVETREAADPTRIHVPPDAVQILDPK